jgi:hypothetical protein
MTYQTRAIEFKSKSVGDLRTTTAEVFWSRSAEGAIGGLLGAHRERRAKRCGRAAVAKGKSAKGIRRGESAKGVSRPNGIHRGRARHDMRRTPTGGPITLPSPVEPAGGAPMLTAPEMDRASTSHAWWV